MLGKALSFNGPVANITRCKLRTVPALNSSGRLRIRGPVKVAAELQIKGKKHLPSDVVVKNILGEGSYGQVFEGLLETNEGTERVVLKRVKTRVQGANEMAQMEHLLNVYAARVAKGSVADFLGYCEVTDTAANKRLTPGLWLMWRYEGANTLSYYIRRRDCHAAIAADMGIPVGAVVPTVMKQIFEGLSTLHSAGLVHRDVKPLNIIFAENEKRFKFIDLGACADLRQGTNYVPDESILDPFYCPPEQYVLPTRGPNLSAHAAPIAMAMSPLLWAQHKPDRFDMYSAGLILMQLALQRLRTNAQLKTFNKMLAECKHDLMAWKRKANLPARETVVLDANNGAGWELAAALLRPRKVAIAADGHVVFVNGQNEQRPTAVQALSSQFTKVGAVAPGSVQPDADEVEALYNDGSKMSLWNAAALFRNVTEKLFDLEAKMVNQASATEKQGTEVSKLRTKVAAKQAEPEQLERAEKVLGKMEHRLNVLADEFSERATLASKLMGVLGLGKQTPPTAQEVVGKSRSSSKDTEPPPPPPPPSPPSRSRKPLWAREESTPTSSSGSAAVNPTGPSLVQDNEATMGITSVATDFIYKGLKFTAFALTAATELAERMKRDAEDAMGEAETMTKAKREASVALLEAMAALKPPISSSSTWEEVAGRLPEDDRWIDLSEKVQKKLFGGYIEALQRAEERKLKRAVKGFRELLASSDLNENSSWGLVQPFIAQDERYKQVVTEDVRKQLFRQYVNELKEAADARRAAQEAENNFRSMLQGLDTMFVATNSWAAVRREVQNDARYTAVKRDSTRKRIFYEVKPIAVEMEAKRVAKLAEEEAVQQAAKEAEVAAAREAAEKMLAASTAALDSVDVTQSIESEEEEAADTEQVVSESDTEIEPVEAALKFASHNGVLTSTDEPEVGPPSEAATPNKVDRLDRLSSAIQNTQARFTHLRENALTMSHSLQQQNEVADAEALKNRAMLEELRAQQERLRSEYERVEKMLKEAEARLGSLQETAHSSPSQQTKQLKTLSGNTKKAGGAPELYVVEQDPEGNVVFRFGKDVKITSPSNGRSV